MLWITCIAIKLTTERSGTHQKLGYAVTSGFLFVNIGYEELMQKDWHPFTFESHIECRTSEAERVSAGWYKKGQVTCKTSLQNALLG